MRGLRTAAAAIAWRLRVIGHAIRGAFDSADIPVAVFGVGLLLIGVGASYFHRGLGLLICGLLLVLYFKPLGGWLK